MRDATVASSASYLAGRNDAIIALLYDTGLRVGELVALDVEMLDLDEGVLMLPASIQKDYPNDNTPQYTEIELASEVVRTLRMYLNSRWKDSPRCSPHVKPIGRPPNRFGTSFAPPQRPPMSGRSPSRDVAPPHR
jgi:integrase/recombinase XerC/integrase/recombinase XerD